MIPNRPSRWTSAVVSLFVAALLAVAAAAPATAGRILPVPGGPAGAFAIADRGSADAEKVAGGLVDVVEYYNAGLDHYFITADPAETAVLDGGAFGGVWKRTGATFPAWDVTGAPAGTVPVCRFFGTDKYRADGSRIGPDSHFYTADPAECAFVKTAYQSVASDGRSYPAWTFEANAFNVKLPVAGACPSGTQPLYRAYNNGARGNPNHRYSTSLPVLQGLSGWVVEGLVMCLPASGGGTTPQGSFAACAQGNCPAGAALLGTGLGFVNVIVTVSNTGSTAIDYVVPAGTTFVATPPTIQDGIAVDRLQATVPAGSTRSFVLQLYCINESRGPSSASTTYAQGSATTNPGLQDVIALTGGKLGAGVDTYGFRAQATQYAIWEITDGRGALTAAQRSLYVSVLSLAPDDPAAAQAFAAFIQTLTILPH